jgi:hypothetical protein
MKTLAERAEDARLAKEIEFEAWGRERKEKMIRDAVAYFAEHLEDAKYIPKLDRFELGGEYFKYEYQHGVSLLPGGGYEIGFDLCEEEGYWPFNKRFSNLAGYGSYLKEKQEKQEKQEK